MLRKLGYCCYSLESLILPDGVTSIGEYAFRGCESLSNLVIPNSVTSVGKCAFYDCSSLSNVVIPDSITLQALSVMHLVIALL